MNTATAIAPTFPAAGFAADTAVAAPAIQSLAIQSPAAQSPAAQSAPVRPSVLQVIRHRASLVCTLSLLGSSAAYCVYALGHIA